MASLEEIYDVVEFARKSIFSEDHIDDYITHEYITKLLQFFHIDAWLVTRNNMLITQAEVNDEGTPRFVMLCFEGASALFVDKSSQLVTYFDASMVTYDNDGTSCAKEDIGVPKLVQRFIKRTYPNHHTHHIVLKCVGDKHLYKVPTWMMATWFVVVLSKCKDAIKGSPEQMHELLQREYEDVSFVASFHDMCWEIVSATKMKHVHHTYVVDKASLFAVLDILHQVIKCYCKTIVKDGRHRNEKYQFNTHLTQRIEMSKGVTYNSLLTCWDRLQKWSSLHKGDMTYIKNAHIEMCHMVLVHYQYLVKNLNNHSGLVDEYNKTINTVMDLRDNVDDLITRVLCHC